MDTHYEHAPVRAYLADGFLSGLDMLVRLAEAEEQRQHGQGLPFGGSRLAVDDLYLILANHAYETFIEHTPLRKQDSRWCEGWLFTPKPAWPSEFALVRPTGWEDHRRILVTLYEDWSLAEQWTRKLLKSTDFTVIPQQDYLNPEEFRRKGMEILKEVCEPFIAPRQVAAEKIRAHGYNYVAFGR